MLNRRTRQLANGGSHCRGKVPQFVQLLIGGENRFANESVRPLLVGRSWKLAKMLQQRLGQE